MAPFEIEAGGYENVGCTERDVRNVERNLRKERKVYDAQMLIEHFQECQGMNPSFYYNYKIDSENRLTHCFWADATARKNYHLFGDVVVFDTTYDTNQYRLIFAPFTRVNHHCQSTTFGCGFLKDEKAESFEWLFEQLLYAMLDRPPTVIITDQDLGMRAAISKVFPQTHHRYCMWHIMCKVCEKVGAIENKSDFIESLGNIVWNSETPDEFESRWNKHIADNKLQENEWLQSLYKIRNQWIPAFAKDIFLAGIRTTQRSESMNSFFDQYVSKKNTLIDFILRFERAIRRQRYNELKADHETFDSRPHLMTNLDMEKQMTDIYTREMFTEFQSELQESLLYGAMLMKDDGCV